MLRARSPGRLRLTPGLPQQLAHARRDGLVSLLGRVLVDQRGPRAECPIRSINSRRLAPWPAAIVLPASEDRVRDVIRHFNADGFDSLYPRYKGGYPLKFTLGQRRAIKKIAKSKPAEHDLPFSAWSLSKLAEFLFAELPYL
jgi:hypothetical protein